MSTAPLDRKLKVRRWTPVRATQGKFYRSVHGLTTTVVAPFTKGIDNVVSGMSERVYYIDSLGTRRPTCNRDGAVFDPLLGRLVGMVGACNRATGVEFIQQKTGSKKRLYLRAREQLNSESTTLRELAMLKFFTKWESTSWEKQQVPRIISPRDPRFNYLLGKYLQPVEKRLYEACSHLFTGIPVIAKGLTCHAKGQLIADKLLPGWVCVGLDASRFDQTIGETLLKVEHAIYNRLYDGDRLLSLLLKQQLHNVGKAVCRDGMCYANIGAMRCSGDQNTSLGNCLISTLLARLYFDEHGINGDILNDGDDLLMFLPETCLHLLDDLSEWYLQWGLRMKIEQPARTPEQVEFCQGRPVWTPDGYVLVRNPRKAFNKDYCGGSKLEDWNHYLVHLRSVGVCGLSMAAGIPIMQEFYSWGITNGMTGKHTDYLSGLGYQCRIQQEHGYFAKRKDIDPRTRESFAQAFSIEVGDQLDIEGSIASMELCRPPISPINIEETNLPKIFFDF